jgi:hypothetical protein
LLLGVERGGAVPLSHAQRRHPIAIAERSFLNMVTPKNWCLAYSTCSQNLYKSKARKIKTCLSYVYA